MAPYALPEFAPKATGQLYDPEKDPRETRSLFLTRRKRREKMDVPDVPPLV